LYCYLLFEYDRAASLQDFDVNDRSAATGIRTTDTAAKTAFSLMFVVNMITRLLGFVNNSISGYMAVGQSEAFHP